MFLTSQQHASVPQGRMLLTSQQHASVPRGRMLLTSQQHASVPRERMCLTSQQHASVSQGRICSDNCSCCHTEIEVVDPTYYLTLLRWTDTGPACLSTDHITPAAWQSSHKSISKVTRTIRPGTMGWVPVCVSRQMPYHWATEAFLNGDLFFCCCCSWGWTCRHKAFVD